MPPDRKPRHQYARPATPRPHRPPPVPHPTTTSSSSTILNPSDPSFSGSFQLPRDPLGPLYPLLSRIRIFVVPTKMDGQLPETYARVEALGGIVSPDLESCQVAVTVLRGRPRLAKLLDDAVDSKWVLHLGWVTAAWNACVRYRAELAEQRGSGDVEMSGEVSDGESEIQPVSTTTAPTKRYVPPPTLPPREAHTIPNTGLRIRRLASEAVNEPPVISDLADDSTNELEKGYVSRLPDLEPFPVDIPLSEIPNRAVQRCSPLTCVNQDIIDAIKPIYQMREYDDPEQKNSNVLSYKRSMSILKSVPRRIESGSDALQLLDLGPKVAERIDEYLETGQIAESLDILTSDRFHALELFSSIFTIGTAKSRELYDDYGCRTLDDVSEYYALKEAAEWDSGVVGEGVPAGYKSKPGGARFGTGRAKRRSRDATRRRKEGRMSQAEIVREWIALKPDLDTKIPRVEVGEIERCIAEQLEALMPGCRYTLTGGYRRGKPESNDVDIVICPPEDDVAEGLLLKDLYTRMADLGIVTHVLQLTASSHQFTEHNNFDGLDKAFVLFRLPPKPSEDGTGTVQRRLTRRVDFIMAPKAKYALAVLGWSGSMMFERDLKRYAENEMQVTLEQGVFTKQLTLPVYRNLKFDSGRFADRSTGEEYFPKTEREIFDILALRYVRPKWRNADA